MKCVCKCLYFISRIGKFRGQAVFESVIIKMFGQQNTTFGQPLQTGGIFGVPKQTTGFLGQAMQTQAPGGNLFGQSASSGFLGVQAPPLQSQGFGGGFGQNTSQVGQGGFGSALAQQTSAPGFGMQAQPVQSGFGSTSAFGGGSAFPQQQPQSGFFGQSTQASIGFGSLAAQQKPAFGGQSSFQGAQNQFQLGQGQGGFGQGQQLFGGQPQQPQTPAFGQQQTQAQGGMFGQQMNNFQGNLMLAQQQPMTMMGGQSGGLYGEPQFYLQQTGTINRMVTLKTASSLEMDGKQQTLHFSNIRIEDDLSRLSTQMLRLYDMKQIRGTPQQNYEFLAMQEYNQNQQRYPHFQKVQQLLSGNKQASQNSLQQSTLQFGQSAQSATQQSTWGQPTQQPQQTQLYGGQQQQNSSTLFGGQGIAGAFAQQQKPLGQQSTLFGGGTGTQQNTFGQQSQPFNGLSAAPTQILGTPTLFGQQTQTQGGQGIFGQNQQAQNTLFGQQTLQQQPPQPTNLFGSGTQPQQQPSLQFGQQQQQPQQNSLFGGAGQQQQQQSSLFGPKPPAPAINVGLGAQSTLFGGQIQTPSLFGNNQPTQQPQQTSLFGAKPAGSSLFPSAPQAAGSSLFGQQQTTLQFGQQNQPLFGGQQPQQQVQQFNQPQGGQVELYNSHDPLGLNQFLSHSRPMEDYQKEIDELKSRIDAKYPAFAADSLDLSVIYQQSVPHLNVTLQYLNPSLNEIYQEEALRQRAKQAAKLEQMCKSQLNAKKGIQLNITTPPINLYKSETQPQTAQIIKPDLSINRRDLLSKTTTSSDTIRVTLRYQHKRQEYYNERVEIHKSRETGELLKKVFFWLSREFNYDGSSDNVKIYFNEQLLDQNKPLKEVGIEEDCVINVCLQNSQTLINQIVLDDDKSLEELLPKAPKEGYQCSPSMEDLRKMTVKELENVKNFTVCNQFGSILWLGKTDVTRVDLKDIVTIIQNNAEVYDDERHGSTKPTVGQKLNKEAIITLTGIKPKQGQSAAKKEQNLKRNIEASDAEHLSYDCVNYEWQFKVKHFTNYGTGPDDDEEMDSIAPLPAQPKPVTQPIITAQKQQSIFETQQQMPPTTQMIIDDSEFMLSEIHPDAIFKNQQNQKRFHIESPSQQQPIIVQKLEIPIEIPYKFNEVPNKVLEKIKERVKLFSQAASANTRRPSNFETLSYLEKIQVKSIKNTSLGRKSVPKPSFHPQGHGILFTQGKTISLQLISRIEAFPIKDVLQKHLQFHQASSIQSQLQGLQLEQSEDFEMIESSSEANPFQDEFMRSLLQTELPQAKLFTSQKQINAFLQDLARHYATFCGQDKKLAHEFYVVCMLNALYGDPTQQLNQLHRSQRGPDYKFQPLDIGQLNESSLSMQKRRRNAATEVMRLFCQSENTVNKQLSASAKEQEVHETALEFLQIGDVRSAVQLLNKFKQTKLSLLVSQSVSNEFAQHYIGKVKIQGSAKKIVDFISGEAYLQKWEQKILYSLMFKEPHHKTLAGIVSEIQIQSQSLLWKLLRAYSQALNADAAVQEMRGELTPAHEIRDYRLRWVTHLVLHSALVFQKLDQTQNQYSCYVPSSTLTESAKRYAHQLVTQGNLMEACQVALLIPENGLRARLAFDLLMRTAVTTEQTDIRVQSDVCDQLQLPEKFRLVALALKLQSANQAGQAVDMWLRSGHVFWAEDLFRRLILPAYLKRHVDLGSIKQLYIEQSLFSTNRAPVQHTHADKILSQMKEKARKTSYQQWSETQCGLYQRVKLVQRGFCGENVHLQQQELTEISRLIPDHGTDPLTMWLKTEVHQMLVAITARLRIGVLATAPEIGNVSEAQAKRGCEQVMMKGLIDRMIPNLHGQSLQ